MPAERTPHAPLVVGVLPGRSPEVLETAVELARVLAAPLVCAFVDEASYLVEWDPARSAHRLSLHPEADNEEIRAQTERLRTEIAAVCDGPGVEWSLRTLAGDPARALGRLAADAAAAMIVVGTPEPGLGHRITAALNGSVAAWLSHHQDRPILIVPARSGGPGSSRRGS
ncbi:universal stress protein [Arthrobacter sp. UKPF54-2]|uniref:universal stress protein n=1 Tax=Arthrobacter sp. UKPF54-2 TaxID=2600159 RepID=UPI0011B18652|nr:universal stress protein [Arthrobacter sp. UKPF54-2]QDY89761.1 universal stress protein [Arthrobacter sp. UKPF54-2]